MGEWVRWHGRSGKKSFGVLSPLHSQPILMEKYAQTTSYWLPTIEKANFERENGQYGVVGLGGTPSGVRSPFAHQPSCDGGEVYQIWSVSLLQQKFKKILVYNCFFCGSWEKN